MSISSVSQNYWNTAPAPLTASITDQISYSPPATSANSGAPTSGPAIPSGAPGSGTNPFQQLATDLQAALVQVQSANGSGTTSGTSSATSTSGTTSPLQQLQTDLQATLAQLQSGGGASTTTSQVSGTTGSNGTDSASGATSTDPTQTEAVHHHHRHHHQDDAQQAASTTTGTGQSSTSNALSGGGGSLGADLGQLQQDLTQALQSYGATSGLSLSAQAGATV